MRVKKVILKKFKRFDDLTIDLGNNPQKIVALIGPNGCGKSSIFDAFELKMQSLRAFQRENDSFYSKAIYYEDKGENVSYEITIDPNDINNKSFYIRTSYRFTPKYRIKSMEAAPSDFDPKHLPSSTISLDKRLEENYKRLLASAYQEFENGTKTGNEVRIELIGKLNEILNNILDIEISSFGNIFNDRGCLYFKKENTYDFPYENLSSGEKEVIDIVLDLILKVNVYNETVFCIDEPELHLNSSIQRKLLIEIEKIIPDSCQLWISTHSIGFMRALRENLGSKSQILDFSEKNYFVGTQVIKPIIPNRNNWQRIFATAIDDLAGLICPAKIIYCEGRDLPSRSGQDRGFDAKVFNKIFSKFYNDVLFISSGGNTELDQRSNIAILILSKVFSNLNILVLKDRDMSSGRINTSSDREEYLRCNPQNHRVLKRWEIENYLFDKEILKKYCQANSHTFDEQNYDQFVTDINNQNIKDEWLKIKNCCNITFSIGADQFKLELSKFITPDTDVYKELESCIFY